MSGSAAITGAYGYLGSLIRRRLDDAGWRTVALVRSPRQGDRAVPWSLTDASSPDSLRDVEALVHCAYDFAPRSRKEIWRINVDGTSRLLDSAEQAGVARILVLSSMSAYEGTKQIYGQAKLAIEQLTIGVGGIAVRPGLVYGNSPGGMAGQLRRMTRFPLVPLIGGDARQFPVHEDDFAASTVAILAAPSWTPEVLGIAQPQPVAFRTLLASLVAQDGRSCRFVPVPWQVVHAALRLLELARVPLPLRSDSLLGLVRPAPGVPPSRAFPDLTTRLRHLD